MDTLGSDFDAYGGDDGFEQRHGSQNYDDGAHSNPPPSPVGQDERRMQVRAYNHWASLLGNGTLPHIEDLEPEFLGDFGPYSVLLDFSTGSTTPSIQFVGSELQSECRAQDLVETLDDIPGDSLLAKVADNYLRVVSAQGPVNFEAEARNARGRRVAYRGVLLPYSSDYDTIDFVYAVVNWKEIADAATADALLNEIDAALAQQGAPSTDHSAQEPADMANIVHFDRRHETVRDEFAKRLARLRSGHGLSDPEPASSPDAGQEASHDASNQPEVETAPETATESAWQSAPEATYETPSEPGYAAPQEEPAQDNVLSMNGALNASAYGDTSYGDQAYGEQDEPVELPSPSFGQNAYGQEGQGYEAEAEAESAYDQPATGEWAPEPEEPQDYAAYDAGHEAVSYDTGHEAGYADAAEEPVLTPKRNRAVDALGNPIGGAAADDGAEEPAPSPMSIAEEYGLPEWDDEEETEEDVDGVVNPLADIDLNSRLMSLVSSSVRGKSPIDLGSLDDEDDSAEEEAEERPLFRPKAPSVDTLLTPQAYDEDEDEGEFGESYDYDQGPAYGYAPEPEDAPAHEAEALSHEGGEAHYAAAYEAGAEPEAGFEQTYTAPATHYAPAEAEHGDNGHADGGHGEDAGYAAPYEASYEVSYQQPADEAEDEPLSLEPYVAEPEAAAEPLELGEELIVDEQPAPEQDHGAEAVSQGDLVADERAGHPEPESLHGLLAAVHELTEAARTTPDRSRRALYEAVGRAFDVSIKAVIAAESSGHEQRRVIAQLPVGDLAEDGPETALVMVRRTPDGGAEVIGEVPHDTGLLESAAMKLAGR
ncbi:hypothetical protein LCM19_10795 [Qipengyuania flava]|nr:hypothetical protein [Qipengyuania flava]